jgi:hypothetical protein
MKNGHDQARIGRVRRHEQHEENLYTTTLTWRSETELPWSQPLAMCAIFYTSSSSPLDRTLVAGGVVSPRVIAEEPEDAVRLKPPMEPMSGSVPSPAKSRKEAAPTSRDAVRVEPSMEPMCGTAQYLAKPTWQQSKMGRIEADRSHGIFFPGRGHHPCQLTTAPEANVARAHHPTSARNRCLAPGSFLNVQTNLSPPTADPAWTS